MWALAAQPLISSRVSSACVMSDSSTDVASDNLHREKASSSANNSHGRSGAHQGWASAGTGAVSSSGPNPALGVSSNAYEDLTGYGALVGALLEASCLTLRNIMAVVVLGEPTCKEEGQAILEAVYRSHLISRLVDACRSYGGGNSLSARCVAALVNVLSELVLSSSKFLAQVIYIYRERMNG